MGDLFKNQEGYADPTAGAAMKEVIKEARKNMSWSQIGDRLYVDERTVRRWHNRALSHIKVPSEPTVL